MSKGSKSVDELLKEIKDMPSLDFENDPDFIADYTKGMIVEDLLVQMEKKVLTQTDLANKIGKSRQYVSKILNEKGNFTVDSLAKLSVALDCKLNISISGKDEYISIGEGELSDKVANILPFPNKETDLEKGQFIPSSMDYSVKEGKRNNAKLDQVG